MPRLKSGSPVLLPVIGSGYAAHGPCSDKQRRALSPTRDNGTQDDGRLYHVYEPQRKLPTLIYRAMCVTPPLASSRRNVVNLEFSEQATERRNIMEAHLQSEVGTSHMQPASHSDLRGSYGRGVKLTPAITGQENIMSGDSVNFGSPRKRINSFSIDNTSKKLPYGGQMEMQHAPSIPTSQEDVYGYPILVTEEIKQAVDMLLKAKLKKPGMGEGTSAVFARVSVLVEKLMTQLKQVYEILGIGQQWIVEAANCKVEFYNHIKELNNALELSHDEIRMKDSDLSRAKDMLSKLQRIASDARTEVTSAQNMLAEKDKSIETKYAELEAKYITTKEELTDIKEDMDIMEDKITELQRSLKAEEQAHQQTKSQVQELHHKLEITNRDLNDYMQQSNSSNALLKDTQTKMESLEKEKEKITHELINNRTMLEESRKRLDIFERKDDEDRNQQKSVVQERDELRLKNTEYFTRLQMIEQQYESTKNELQRLRTDMHDATLNATSERNNREFEQKMKEKTESELRSVQQKLESITEQFTSSQSELSQLRNDLMSERKEFAKVKEDLKEQHNAEKEQMTNRMRENMESFKVETRMLEERYNVQKLELESQVGILTQEVRCARESRLEMIQTMSQKEQDNERYLMELDVLRNSNGRTNDGLVDENVRLNVENKTLQKQLERAEHEHGDMLELKRQLQDAQEQLEKAEILRRKMHNQIQELKGNIRVMCRVRPLADIDGDAETPLEAQSDGISVNVLHNDKAHSFEFDRVFPMGATQEEVFGEVSQLVQSSIDGYNVCLFSYGQTGSGKTWTMTGGNREQDHGVIRRSVRMILEETAKMKKHGWDYTLEASFCELYNEKLIDLIGQDSTPLEIKSDPVTRRTIVPGLSRHPIARCDDLETLSREATRNRSTAATDMNEHSSRSHCVFTLFVRGTNQKLNTAVEGSLHLCDLAGSERLDKTHAEGDRLGEARAINQSLSCLTTMFLNLSKGHVASFRDSKLTFLLKDCFTGNGKTLMFVNLSPCAESAHESLCSLRFASTVTKVHMGQAQKNVIKSDDPGRPLVSTTSSAPVPNYMKGKVTAAPGAIKRPGTATSTTSSTSRPGTATTRTTMTRPTTARK